VEENYSAKEVERMIKLQDVISKSKAKKISWADAAEIIGVSGRTMRRWRERLEEHGYSGLADRRKGKPSGKRVPLAACEEVLRLYREQYFDSNIRHFHEKIREQHKIELSYTWVQQALQGAGLVSRGPFGPRFLPRYRQPPGWTHRRWGLQKTPAGVRRIARMLRGEPGGRRPGIPAA
jgi:transposase